MSMAAKQHDWSPRSSWRGSRIPVIYFPGAGKMAAMRVGDREVTRSTSPEPVPFILTAEEVCRLTRIDETAIKNPEKTLEYYRQQGSLKGTQIGRDIRYLLSDVLDFVESLKDLNPH